MSIAELKSKVDRLLPEERRQLTAYLVIRDRMADPEFLQEAARKIDENDPEHWLSLEEAEKLLAPKIPSSCPQPRQQAEP